VGEVLADNCRCCSDVRDVHDVHRGVEGAEKAHWSPGTGYHSRQTVPKPEGLVDTHPHLCIRFALLKDLGMSRTEAESLVRAVLHKEIGFRSKAELHTTLEAAENCSNRPEVAPEEPSNSQFAGVFVRLHSHQLQCFAYVVGIGGLEADN